MVDILTSVLEHLSFYDAQGCPKITTVQTATAPRVHPTAQVRCMAAVLLMVGRGEEEPGVVRKLLDMEATPSKPYYNMAPEVRIFIPQVHILDAAFKDSASIQHQYGGHMTSVRHQYGISTHQYSTNVASIWYQYGIKTASVRRSSFSCQYFTNPSCAKSSGLRAG